MVYLIHIEQPLKPASHYITYAEDPDARTAPRAWKGGARAQ